MTDVYVTSGMVQSNLTSSYLNHRKRKSFTEAVLEMSKTNSYVTVKPSFPKEISLKGLSDDEFIDLLNDLPININNIVEAGSGDAVDESDILPENSDILAFKHFNYGKNSNHSHNYFEICYVFKGDCQLVIEKDELILKEGELCIIAPKTLHDVVVNDSVVITILIRRSNFDSAFFTLLSKNDLLSYFFRIILYGKTAPNYLLFSTESSDDIKTLVKNLVVENYKDDIYCNNCSISFANILFSYILRKYNAAKPFYTSAIECDLSLIYTNAMGNDFSLVLQYIQHNYRNLSLRDLAEHFHYSEAHLSTLIKKNTGLNFVSLITNLKMSDAKVYLMNTNLSIEKICEFVGYNSVDHFSRTFKKYYSKSPKQFRKTH